MSGGRRTSSTDDRAGRQGEPADACAHRRDLLCIGGRHLVDDVHHLAHDAVHGLAALREDVGDSVVRARWVVVGSSVASSPPRTRRAALRATVARSFIVDAGTKSRMRSSIVSVTSASRRNVAVSRSDSLNTSGCAADVFSLEHGQIERRRLQVVVGVATGKQLGEKLGLQRLGAVEDVAVIAVVGLEQLPADLHCKNTRSVTKQVTCQLRVISTYELDFAAETS
eukprot:784173-Pleurochrysis_carterae.AAC.1